MRKITHSISDYFHLNQLRKNTHWRYVDEKLMFEHEGLWYDADEFDILYPQYDYKQDRKSVV